MFTKPKSPFPKLHYLYFLLASFVLITAALSLYVNHRLTGLCEISMDTNHIWAERLGEYSKISLLAADVNAPGNDVFESLDVDKASARLTIAHARFNYHMSGALADLNNNVPTEKAAPLIFDLQTVNRSINKMVEEANQIFSFFRENRIEQAGARMAVMDKRYYEATKAANALFQTVQEIQDADFAKQTIEAEKMRSFQYFIAGSILLIVLGITAYGHKISQAARDVQARSESFIRALRDKEGRLRSILDTAADCIIIIDEHGIIESFNAAAERVFGWKSDEILGKNVSLLAAPPDAEKHDSYIEQYLNTGMAKVIGIGREVAAIRKDGKIIPFALSISEVRLGDRRLFTGIGRDITDRKRTEETIRRHNKILEQTVRERTSELASAKDKAEASNRAKSAFLANVSHELRTPLHGILSFASFGIKKHATAQPDKLYEYFYKINQSGKTLLALLDDLLDLTKLEFGTMTFKFQKAELGTLIKSVSEEFSTLASERKLAIRCIEQDAQVKTDLDLEKIKQVIRNLLSNAVKFSPRGGTIDLCMKPTNRSVTVTVRDQGPGIPEEELEAVFDKFVQSSKTKTGAGGTGLGLSICRQVISAHRGRIWAENNPKQGATFSFELPLDSEDKTTESPILIGARGKMKIRQ